VPGDSMPDSLSRLRGRTGQRVVVRYRPDPDERAMVDVLGVLEHLAHTPDGVVRIRADRDGSLVEVPAAAVVTGKPVPPRVTRRPPEGPRRAEGRR
jgi:hypothetical protein